MPAIMHPHENTGFHHLGLAPKMLGLIESMKFVKPTPIQHKAIPIALEGSDVVGVAQTGTGKTMAFGIPLIQRLMSTQGKALVLVPTLNKGLSSITIRTLFTNRLNFPYTTRGGAAR